MGGDEYLPSVHPVDLARLKQLRQKVPLSHGKCARKNRVGRGEVDVRRKNEVRRRAGSNGACYAVSENKPTVLIF